MIPANGIDRAEEHRIHDYLAYGSIFTGAMFLPKKKVMFIFPPEKPQMSAGGW